MIETIFVVLSYVIWPFVAIYIWHSLYDNYDREGGGEIFLLFGWIVAPLSCMLVGFVLLTKKIKVKAFLNKCSEFIDEVKDYDESNRKNN